jgi:23S rRNA (adenine2503-C2)-methyltransferase
VPRAVDAAPRPEPPALPILAGLSLAGLGELLSGWGEPVYRARQAFEAVHRGFVLAPGSISTLPAATRARLAAATRPGTEVVEVQESQDGTRKLLLALADGMRTETVLIPEGERRTVCVSTQVGCPVRCVFCASGVGGLARNLLTGEIAEQVIRAGELLGRRPTHVVVMGMGEPLANLERLTEAIRLWTDARGLHLSPRRITVSTASTGALVDRLLATGLRVQLAVSLHAPDDETRARLVPTSRPGRVQDLVDAAARYARHTGRDATIEYVLLDGENDLPEHAEALARLLGGRHLHVNLIPFNPVSHRPDLRPPSGRAAQGFARRLAAAGVSATLRTRRGEDIAAACGQLALDRALGAGSHDASAS